MAASRLALLLLCAVAAAAVDINIVPESDESLIENEGYGSDDSGSGADAVNTTTVAVTEVIETTSVAKNVESTTIAQDTTVAPGFLDAIKKTDSTVKFAVAGAIGGLLVLVIIIAMAVKCRKRDNSFTLLGDSGADYAGWGSKGSGALSFSNPSYGNNGVYA